jgi:hypothetical protein
MADAVHLNHGFNLGWLQMRVWLRQCDESLRIHLLTCWENEMNTGEAESVDRGTAWSTEYFVTGHQGTIRFSLGQGTNSG